MAFSYATPAQYADSAEAGGQDALDLSSLDTPSNQVVDNVQLQDALESATREMEAILARRYLIARLRAIAPPLKFMRDANIAIARYLLDIRYGAREDVRKRYEDILTKLRRIAAGTEELLDDEGNPIPEEDTTGLVNRPGLIGRGTSYLTRSTVRRLMG